MERVSHGHGHAHIHRKATDHWSQLRAKKDNTIWIVLIATVAATVVLGGLYLILQ